MAVHGAVCHPTSALLHYLYTSIFTANDLLEMVSLVLVSRASGPYCKWHNELLDLLEWVGVSALPTATAAVTATTAATAPPVRPKTQLIGATPPSPQT